MQFIICLYLANCLADVQADVFRACTKASHLYLTFTQ